MGQLDYIVAIEIGSSKVRGIVGKKNSDESIQVMAYASELSNTFIKKGVVFNIDKTAQALTTVINKLEGFLDTGVIISKVYVGFGGKSLRTERNSISRTYGEEIKISQEEQESINEENLRTVYKDKVILDAIPQNYKLGSNIVTEPVGIPTKMIEGRFLNLIANELLKKNLLEAFEQAKIEIADLFITPLTLAENVLSDTDKRSGCVLVDFGYDTTSVLIFKDNILRNLTVLPIGGNNITVDVAKVLRIDESVAEDLKVKFGSAISNPTGSNDYLDDMISVPGLKNEVNRYLLDDIIVARAEEIVENVRNVIEKSGYYETLFSDIFITGGASKLKNLPDLIEKTCKRMKVTVIRNKWNLLASSFSEIVGQNNENDSVLSLLCSGKDSCCYIQDDSSVLTNGNLFGHSAEMENQENKPAEDNETSKKIETKEEHVQEKVELEDNTKTKTNATSEKRSETKKKKNGFFSNFANMLFGDDEQKWNSDDKSENEKTDDK